MLFAKAFSSKSLSSQQLVEVDIGITFQAASAWAQLFKTTMNFANTVKILKIGTPKIITIIVLQLEQLDFTVQYCVQKMQTE